MGWGAAAALGAGLAAIAWGVGMGATFWAAAAWGKVRVAAAWERAAVRVAPTLRQRRWGRVARFVRWLVRPLPVQISASVLQKADEHLFALRAPFSNSS